MTDQKCHYHDGDYPNEPNWDEFIKSYKENLGRHSVNYHSWYAVEDEGMFKDLWDFMEGKYTNAQFYEKYPVDMKFDIHATDINTGKDVIIKCKSDRGNIEDMFGFQPKIFSPFMKIEDGYLDGFALFRGNRLFPVRGSLAIQLVDNTHWPALNRARFILINKKYVPEEIRNVIRDCP